jgi:lipopolysaccharide export system protein LptA
MRVVRWLLLLSLGLVAAFVGSTYVSRTSSQQQDVPKPAKALPQGVDITAEEWRFSQTENGRKKVEIRAKDFKQVKDQDRIELQGVTLEVPHGDGKERDIIKTERAEFDQKAESLYADGEVEIIMDVPEGAEISGRLIKIQTSGVKFEKAGRALTDRPVSFAFDRGEGKSVGAEYDMSTRELHLKSEVELIWKGQNGEAVPMKIETGSATYKEKESMVFLVPWAKLTRGGLRMQGENSVVKLDKGRIDLVESSKARGVDEDKGRKIEYAASQLNMKFTEKSQIQKIEGEGDAELVSEAATSRTEVKCRRIDLDFAPSAKETSLTRALASGQTEVVSRPVAKPGTNSGDIRVLKSDVVEMFMREAGQEIDRVETHGPGSLELIPTRAGQPHRWLDGDRFWIKYGKQNTIESFRTINARTRTVRPAPPPTQSAKKNPPVLTWSHELRAQFDPKTQQMSRLEQERDFRYEAGDRKAQADRAQLDQTTELITLTGNARMWDPTGTTLGDQMVMNQKTNDFVAEGNVRSTRLPEKKGNSSAMLNKEEPTQATARRMSARNNNRLVRYEGQAVAWQGANRVQADVIEIDRDAEVMRATGQVTSQFVDKSKKKDDKDGKVPPKKETPKKEGAAVYTVVKAPEMIYTEDDRVAHYKGGALLNRPGLQVKGFTIKAYLNDSSDDESLNRAIADGRVEIVQTNPQRTRTGTSEHADYYVGEERIVLEGGAPLLVDSVKGRTVGRQLTYFAKNDRLLVNGVEQKPSESVLKRK